MTTRSEAIRKLHELTPAIAQELGGKVKDQGLGDIKGVSTEVELEGGASVVLVAEVQSGQARVKAYGSWPRGEDQYLFRPHPNDKLVRITAAMSRGAEAVAGDIERRLLPTYLEQYQEQLEIRDASDARKRLQRDKTKVLARVFGAEARWTDPSLRREPKIYRWEREGLMVEGHVTVTGGKVEVNLELRGLTEEQAHQIAEILNE